MTSGAVRIGINPITWTNDDMPELGGDIPLATCLAETKLAGYAGTEMGGKFPRTAAELGPVLAAGEWAAYGRKVTALAERMATFGVGMAFHHHMGTIVQTDAEVDALMAHSGAAAGLLFDSGHCLFAGGDPAVLLARHIGRVVHVHCKDVRRAVLDAALAGDWSFMAAVLKGVFTVPGDGGIDFGGLLGRLRAAGYGGWLVVEAEQDPRVAHPLTYARMGFESLRATARGAGFVVEG